MIRRRTGLVRSQNADATKANIIQITAAVSPSPSQAANTAATSPIANITTIIDHLSTAVLSFFCLPITKFYVNRPGREGLNDG